MVFLLVTEIQCTQTQAFPTLEITIIVLLVNLDKTKVDFPISQILVTEWVIKPEDVEQTIITIIIVNAQTFNVESKENNARRLPVQENVEIKMVPIITIVETTTITLVDLLVDLLVETITSEVEN